MKGKFSTLDLVAMVAQLQKLFVGGRVNNIYDLNSRTYLLKFSGDVAYKFLLLESGVRLHPTEYDRDKPKLPSGFTSKVLSVGRGVVVWILNVWTS